MNSDLLVNALDAVTDAVLVCDRQGLVLHANRQARELFGAVPSSRAEVLRHPLGATAKEQQVSGAAVVVIPRFRPTLSLAERERQAIELPSWAFGNSGTRSARRSSWPCRNRAGSWRSPPGGSASAARPCGAV